MGRPLRRSPCTLVVSSGPPFPLLSALRLFGMMGPCRGWRASRRNSRAILRTPQSVKDVRRTCRLNLLSRAKKEPQSQNITREPKNFWTIRGHYPIKEGYWGKSHQKVHPRKFGKTFFAYIVFLLRFFCPWFWALHNFSSTGFYYVEPFAELSCRTPKGPQNPVEEGERPGEPGPVFWGPASFFLPTNL